MDEEKKDILDFFFDGDIIIAGAQGYIDSIGESVPL